ncbi:MAG: hypothetical protein ACXVRS_00350 [Gaiellaceae bacterium]
MITTRANDHLALPAGVAALACAFACSAATASSGAGPPSGVVAAGNLRASCQASPATPGATARVTVRVADKNAWGFWLAGTAHGYSPGEPLLAWLFDPRWSGTPSCLAAGNASVTGAAHAKAAIWYRASAAGSYTLCLVGVGSGRTACGTLQWAR